MVIKKALHFIGDYIGVCINLDDANIEIFLNGKSLGIPFKNINVGENVAYFAGLSCSMLEKQKINLGQIPFKYEYPGYEPIDIPKSSYNGDFEISQMLFELLDTKVLKMLCKKDFNKR